MALSGRQAARRGRWGSKERATRRVAPTCLEGVGDRGVRGLERVGVDGRWSVCVCARAEFSLPSCTSRLQCERSQESSLLA